MATQVTLKVTLTEKSGKSGEAILAGLKDTLNARDRGFGQLSDIQIVGTKVLVDAPVNPVAPKSWADVFNGAVTNGGEYANCATAIAAAKGAGYKFVTFGPSSGGHHGVYSVDAQLRNGVAPNRAEQAICLISDLK